jgi:small-conductance mechanosensitive channel
VTRTLETILLSGLILSVTVWVATLAVRLLELRSGAPGAAAASATGVVRSVVKMAVLTIGVLVLLSTLGISIGPVLTTMGLGGLAVALGLQPTLSNLFAGMQITLGGTLNVGDFVRLESGEEGYIEDIHWRVTRMKTLFDTFVVIPNARLAESIVLNYHLPDKGIAFLVPVGVHSGSDLDHVERVTCDVARAVMRAVQGGVPDFDPFIRYKAFGDSSVDFNVILRVREFKASLLIRHAFIKALVRAYAAEGIVIPFPVRALNLEQEGAVATDGGTRLTFNREATSDAARGARREDEP